MKSVMSWEQKHDNLWRHAIGLETALEEAEAKNARLKAALVEIVSAGKEREHWAADVPSEYYLGRKEVFAQLGKIAQAALDKEGGEGE